MAGYFIYSLDANVFQQLTTTPTPEQSLLFADAILDDLEEALEEYEDDQAADPEKWPLERKPLARAIRKRLASPDWYADLTMGDAVIWDTMLHTLTDETGMEMGIGFACANDGYLYWNAAQTAARQGATMMAEPAFGNNGFRYSGTSQGELELMYSMYLPAQVQQLLKQLDTVAPHFLTLPDVADGERHQFFRGLLEPVRSIAEAGRVMWVQTDT